MWVITWLRKQKAVHSFKKSARMGKNVQIAGSASCQNGGDRNNIVIGEGSHIKGGFVTYANAKIEVGDHFYLGPNSIIGAKGRIQIGRCVMISNGVMVFDNNNHPVAPKARERMSMVMEDKDSWSWRWARSAPVIIEDNVWIGQHSSVLKGVTIGKGAVVATRAVVTKDVPPYTIVAGNPARVVKHLDPDADITEYSEV